jgi:predicted DNA-binding transcriptional regulator AlpA
MTNNCKTIREFRSWLEENSAFLENVLLYGSPDGEDALYVALQLEEITVEAERAACRLGFDPGNVPAMPTPRSSLMLLGRLMAAVEQQNPAPTLDVQEMARLLGCTERTIWRHEGKGLIPEARRISGVVRWDRAEIEEWLAAQGNRN